VRRYEITAGDATKRGPLDSLYLANAYDPEGNLTNSNRRTSAGDVTNIGVMMNGWVYDRANRPTQLQQLDGVHSLAQSPADTIYYDPAGNKTLIVTRRGDRIPATYDALNEMTIRIYPQHTDGARLGAIDSSFVKVAENTAGAVSGALVDMDTLNTPAFVSAYPRGLDFGAYVGDSYAATAEGLGVGRDEVVQVARNSFAASFLGDAQRERHLAELDRATASG